MADRLRFGIMCHGMRFPAWEADCIRRLLDVAAPVLLIVDAGAESDPAQPQKPTRNSITSRLRRLAEPEMPWTLYQRYFVNRRSRIMRKVDLSDVLADVPTLTCRTRNKGRFSRYFKPEDIDAIRAVAPDFVMRFAFDIVRGRVLDVPRYGVWSFHHDDIDRYRGGPPCFWEIYRNDPVTGAVLQRINDRLDGGVILKRGWFRTFSTSYRSNRDRVYQASAAWPAQVCQEIARGDVSAVTAEPTSSTAPIDYRPGLRQLIWFLSKCTWRSLKAHAMATLRADQWNCGVIESAPESLLHARTCPTVRWFPTGRRHEFIADPMPLAGESDKVLVEGFDYRTGRGFLTAYDLNTGCPVPDQPVPEAAVHVSYPFSFQDGSTRYCLPETAAAGRLEAWKQASDGTWQRHRTLLNLPVLEPTVVLRDGLWWLFGSLAGPDAECGLWLWFAATPDGPWQPHPGNPVRMDVRSSRPAGPLFEVGGQLYRPAQNCAVSYGGSVVINRILELTPERFREEAVTEIIPDTGGPYPHGLHTFAATGSRVVIDGKRRVFIPAATLSALRIRWQRIWRNVLRRSGAAAHHVVEA